MSLVAELRANPYFRIFISIVTAVSLTILVLSFTLYWGFDGILTTKTVTLVRANLNQLSESTGQTLASVEKTLVQAYFDDSLQRFGFNRPPEDTDLNRGLDQLEKYRFVSTTIQSMYILNKATQTVYIASDTAPSKVQSYQEFFDGGLLTAVKEYRGDRPFLPVARVLPSGREGVTLLFYDAVNPLAADSVLAANLDLSLFRDRLAKMEDGALGTNLIVGRGLVVTARPEDGPRWTRALRALEPRFQPAAPPGSETLPVDGVPSLVTWTAPDKNGWRSVSVVPVAALVAELDSLRGTMVVSALLVLLLGSLAAVLAAWYLFRPIRERLDRVGQLEEQSREGRGALKERILRRILTEAEGGGLAAPDPQELSAFAIGLDPGAPCRVLLLRIDGYRSLSSSLGPPDLSLLKGALLGAARESLALWGPVEAVEMEEEKLAVLMTASGDPGDEALEAALRGVQARTLSVWKVSVTCSWSDRGDNLGYASYLYRQALQNSFYRFFLGHGSLIGPSAAADHRRDDYAYPVAKERQLLEALMLRNLEATKACYLEIVDYLSGYSQTTVNLGLSHLSLGLVMALDSLRAHWFSDVPFHFDTAVNLGDFETAAELNQHFFDLFEGVITLMNTRRHHKQNDLVTRVNDVLEKEFANPNLSLDFVADRLGLTPTHVSKAYRKNCLKSIPDVILEYRIRRCRELLLKTDLTIAEVAEGAGFRNANYFHTLFRKVEGTTPAEFRKQKLLRTAPQS